MNRLKRIVGRRSFWILATMLVVLGLVHYLTPQERTLPITPYTLVRHAVDRIIFVLPVAGATFVFGQAGGLVALALAVAIMLPRALFISPYPADALTEILGVGVVGYLVVWIIEIQGREKRLHQEIASRLRTINAMTSIVTGSLEPEQVLGSALDAVLEVARVGMAAVHLLDPDTSYLILTAHRGLTPACVREVARLKLGQDLAGRVGQSGEPMVVADIRQDSQVATRLAGASDMRAFVAVPLRSSDSVLGVMTLADSQPGIFTDQDVQLLDTIGGQVGVAIENARLHQDVARQLRIEQRLSEMAERITSELELDRILPKALQIAKELVGADGGVIALYDPESNLVEYPYLHNLPQELAEVTASDEYGLAWEVMSSGQPAVIQDYAAYPRAIPAFVRAGVTSIVAVPLVSGDQSFGNLALVTLGKTRSFSDRDMVILTSIGRQAGIAIHNARLYENMRFYARQITRVQEEERVRIARDLHDETIQMLIVISRRIEVLATSQHLPESAISLLINLQDSVGETLKGLRLFVQDLRPSTLDFLGLMATLMGSIDNLKETDEIAAELKTEGEVRRLSPEQELGLFRIFQEAANNIRWHSEATEVIVEVTFHPDKIQMSISDNGRGFNVPERMDSLVHKGKLGLLGMYERARLLGGTLTIQSEQGKGTTIMVDMPTGRNHKGSSMARPPAQVGREL